MIGKYLFPRHQVVVVIPVYKTQINEYESISLQQCLKILHKHPIVFAAPHSLDVSVYKNMCEGKANFSFETFDDEYFRSISGYNRLLMSSGFYGRFLDYRFMLIYQLDAFVFADRLLEWCDKNFDYVGAPWVNDTWYPNGYYMVGNGGFSLRKVRSMWLNVQLFAHKREELLAEKNEDNFFGHYLFYFYKNRFYKVAPYQVAVDFSFEMSPSKCLQMNKGQLPFGCHAWEKYDIAFWRPYFKQEGFDI